MAEEEREQYILQPHSTGPITFRRICWPHFDRVCLLGGCGYCNDWPYRSLGRIRKMIQHRPPEVRDGLTEAYRQGDGVNFGNAQVWRGEWPKGKRRL